MKKILFIILIPIGLYGQDCISNDPDAPCCNELVNIDPLNNNQFMRNNERMKSSIPIASRINFNDFNLNWVNTTTFPYSAQQTTATSINNPFGQYISNHYGMISNFTQFGLPTGAVSNMHPKYGWQMLYAYNGYYPFTNLALKNNPQLGGSRNGPFLMFYNKYSTKLRILVYPDGFPTGKDLSFELKFVDPNNYLNDKPLGSALFNSHGSSQALDDTTTVKSVVAFADNSQAAGVPNPNFADMDLDYDPCVCKTNPTLQFNVRFRDQLTLYAEGKFTGIQTPFNNSGVAPYQFGANYLSSVYTEHLTNEDYAVKNGFTIYDKIDKLAQDYKVTKEMLLLSQALGFFGDKLSGFTIPTNLLGSATTIEQFWGSIQNISGTASMAQIYQQITPENKKLPVGSALAYGVNKLNSSINPAVPNVSILEGEIALRGTITENKISASFPSVELVHPGSQGASNPNLQWNLYPYYNEAPGIFALVKKPKFYWKYKDYRGGNYTNGYQAIATEFEFGLDKIEYALNPAAELDLEKSKISVVLELDFQGPPLNNQFMHNTSVSTIEKFGFQSAKEFLKNCNGSSYHYNTLVSAPVSIDKIQDIKFHFDKNMVNPNMNGYYLNSCDNDWTGKNGSKLNDDVRIKFICNFVFKPNNYGEVNKQNLIYTYESKNNINAGSPANNNNSICTEPTFCNRLSYSEMFPYQNTVLGTTNFSTNTVIYVKDLSIVGNLTTTNGATVTIYYTGAVTISPNAGISSTIIIEPNNFTKNDGPLKPMSISQIKEFCSSNNYKANITKSAFAKSNSKEVYSLSTISLHPNPTSSKTTLTLSGYENTSVSVMIFDLVGREVYTQLEKDITAREHQAVLNTETLQAGTYIVKVFNGTEEKIAKLVILKN